MTEILAILIMILSVIFLIWLLTLNKGKPWKVQRYEMKKEK